MRETRVLSVEESRMRRNSALERHRLYLLAKNDYEQFKQRVGADNAATFFAELKKTRKYDTEVANELLNKQLSIDDDIGAEEKYSYYNSIREDAERYMSGASGQAVLNRFRLHRRWAFLSYLILLLVALFIGAMPWLDGLNLTTGISKTIAVTVGFLFIGVFLIWVWYAEHIAALRIERWKISTNLRGWEKIAFIVAPFVIYKYFPQINFSEIESELYRGISISVIAVSHILLILDCMASLGCRKYYIGLNGIFSWHFTAVWRFDFYRKNSASDNIYREVERNMEKMKLGVSLTDEFRHFQFQPSASLKYIIAYILVDVIHTSCIVLWMFALITALSNLSVMCNIIVAALSFAVVSMLLNTPSVFYFFNTNRFNRLICKNLYADQISHLFRKLFYSLILIGACILLLVHCIPAK